MIKLEDIYNSPNILEDSYSEFGVSSKILLTGHSHQAWPNVAFNGIKKSWFDASEFIDYKWEKAFQKGDEVRAGFLKLMNDTDGLIALASNTHDLLLRFLSALDLKNRRKIVTTDMEFHTVRRQFDRLAEEGVELIKVPAMPPESLSERLLSHIDDKTACVIVSKVFYKNGRIVDNLGVIEKKCQQFGAELLIDAYHVLNVLPFDINKEELTNSFILGGGYKYCQLGEGNCFLRFPKNCTLRPIITGWFSEFNLLTSAKISGEVPYGDGHFRFAGSTYDPVSHYRAAEVFSFFEKLELTPIILREINLHQIEIMANIFDDLDLDTSVISRDFDIPLSKSGGFLVLKTKYAAEISAKLYEKGIYTDFREDNLRLGPAPYISDDKLKIAIEVLNSIVKQLMK